MASSNDAFRQSLERNKAWAEETAQKNPSLFPTLAKGQQPEILYIGCADSRVPETTVLGLQPGDVFVHRNIANIIQPGDLSSQSVIEYAVQYLRVKHIVLCGHTTCGGVNAALGNGKLGLIDAWLSPLRVLREQHSKELEALQDPADQGRLLVEANVKKGVQTLKENYHVIAAIKDRGLQVHGAVFDVATGLVGELDTTEDEATVKRRLEAFELK